MALLLCAVTGAWADEAITVTFAYDNINASGTGTASVASVIETTSVALVGTNASLLSFNGKGNAATYNSVAVPAYSKISVSNDGTTGNNDGVRFTITPAEGCTFTPTSVSLGAIREGTDGGSMYVYANGSALKEATLAKSPVVPGRNKTGSNPTEITKYTQEGYTFSYNISAVTATDAAPLTIDVCMSGLKNKSWGVCDVVITGTYTKVDVTTYTLTTTANPAAGGEITRSPNAAAYSAGKSVTLTAIPVYGYEFVNWTKGGVEQGTSTTLAITTAAAEEEYVAHFSAQTTYALTANADAGGSVSKSPSHDEYLVGDEVTLTATPDEGYYFINWTDDNNSDVEVSTSAAYAYTTTATAASFTAHFGKLFSVTYDIDDYNNTTTKALTNFSTAKSINEKYADRDGNYTIPAYSHYYMYREGYIFSKWEDQDGNQYEKGNTITGITKDIILTPVWVATTQTLTNSAAESTVTWNFGKSTILFNEWQYAPQVGYYTKPQTVNGESIAVPMIVDATSGKVDNSSRSDALAQINNQTKFTIPAIKGMTVVLTSNSNISTTTVAGKTPDEGSGTKTATYNYTGENGTADIVISDGSYYSSIKVIYPVTAVAISTLSGRNYATYVTEKKLDFSAADGITAYIATGLNAGGSAVVLEEVDVVDAGTPIIVKTETKGATVNVPVTTATADNVDANKLVAGNGETLYNAGTYYYLQGDLFHLATSGTLQSGKAYLQISGGAARELSIGFADSDVTAIKGVKAVADGEVYNLSGQRVAAPTKGLYIVNGKKVVVK